MDDDPAQARLARKCLEMAGYAVDIAYDGTTGLALCDAAPYAAVIVDQTMPGLNGLEVIRAMAARKPFPPTIIVTGTGDENVAVEVMKLGASDYLVKDAAAGFVNVLPLVVERAILQRQTLAEKQRMRQELARAQKMKAVGQLATGIAHEINTPIQYITDNARFLQDAFASIRVLLDVYDRLLQAVRQDAVTDVLLREVEEKRRGTDIDYLSAEIPQAIGQSLEGAEHIASIVGAMGQFAHPGNGRKQAADLNHLIEGAITLCRNEWKYAAEVVTHFDPDLPLVSCLPSDINRVVMNLVINAAHAIAEASGNGADDLCEITVHTRRDGPWAEIRVEDTGTGITEAICDRVFDLFFTTKDVGRGTGQGLAIAHAIVVEKHGGTIRFETEVGRGTAFIVRLPIDGRPRRMADDVVEQISPALQAV